MLSLPNTFPFSLYLSLVSPGGRGKSLLKTSSCSVLINKKQFSHRLTGWSVWSTLIGRGMSRLGSHWSRASPVLLAPAVLCHKEGGVDHSDRYSVIYLRNCLIMEDFPTPDLPARTTLYSRMSSEEPGPSRQYFCSIYIINPTEQCAPLSLVKFQRCSALIGRELP